MRLGRKKRKGDTRKKIIATGKSIGSIRRKKPGKIKITSAPFPATKKAPKTIADLRARAIDASLLAIWHKAEAGKPLSAAELKQLEEAEEREGGVDQPGQQPGTPPSAETAIDIMCESHAVVAQLLGITERTLFNWRRDGVNVTSEAPYSFRTYCQEIKQARKLRGCKPKPGPGHAIWSSVLAEGGDGGADPNAPAHDDPFDWTTEKERQETLRIMAARQVIEQEMATQRGSLVPAEGVKATMDELRTVVVNTLTSVMLVPGRIGGLSIDDRARWAEALQEWITEARAAIARGYRAHSGALRAKDSTPEATPP